MRISISIMLEQDEYPPSPDDVIKDWAASSGLPQGEVTCSVMKVAVGGVTALEE